MDRYLSHFVGLLSHSSLNMLFVNHLYHIIASTVDNHTACFQIRLNAGHPIFAAHFPGEPILPGACIVQIVAELTTRWLQGAEQPTMQIQRMSNLKFLAIISPAEVLDLEVQLDLKSDSNSPSRISAIVRGDVEYSKMILTFAHGE